MAKFFYESGDFCIDLIEDGADLTSPRLKYKSQPVKDAL